MSHAWLQWLRPVQPSPVAVQPANRLLGVYGGPDPVAALQALGAQAVWHNAQVALGGAPVWVDEANGLAISGELILDNVPALRAQLGRPHAEALELLGALYAQQGLAGMRLAMGMFAIVIWDEAQQQLLLVRDQVGARTLYYARSGASWWFASQLRPLRHSPAVSGEISLTALRNYLTFAFVPGAETLWQNAFEVRPGTAVLAPSAEVVNYWEPEQGEWDPREPITTHAQRLRRLLEEVVQEQLPPAGPVGIFLSGGLDSSLVTALAARAAPGPVHTYAIHFGEPYPNELAFSDMVARHCRTRHHVLALAAHEVQAMLPETLLALDDPIGDPLTVPNLLLGRMAARDTDVILNGEGGDPCFGGPKNLPMVLNELYAPNYNRATAYLRAYQKCYDDLPRLLSPAAHHALRQAASPEEILQPYLDNPAMPHFLNKLAHINIRLKGADQILTKVNNLTSANAVLGRSPLFDPRVVAASFAIPPNYKLLGATEKAVLKYAVADLLPRPILMRPKSGMLVPVQGWFKHDLRRFASDMLLSRRACLRPYINATVVRDWLDYRGELWPRQGVKLWLLLTLEVWLRVRE